MCTRSCTTCTHSPSTLVYHLLAQHAEYRVALCIAQTERMQEGVPPNQ